MTRWLLKRAAYLLVLLRRSDFPPPHGGQALLDGYADALLTAQLWGGINTDNITVSSCGE